MPRTTWDVTETLFGQRLQELMDANGLSTKDLSDAIGSTYEYMRKLVRGLSLPSKYMLRTIADTLKVPVHDLERLVTADRIRREHGDIPAELSGKNPELEVFDRLWDKLTEQQQELLVTQLKAFAAQNRKHAMVER